MFSAAGLRQASAAGPVLLHHLQPCPLRTSPTYPPQRPLQLPCQHPRSRGPPRWGRPSGPLQLPPHLLPQQLSRLLRQLLDQSLSLGIYPWTQGQIPATERLPETVTGQRNSMKASRCRCILHICPCVHLSCLAVCLYVCEAGLAECD